MVIMFSILYKQNSVYIVQNKTAWSTVSQIGNDLMTINRSELPQHISSLPKDLTGNKIQFCYNCKKIVF